MQAEAMRLREAHKRNAAHLKDAEDSDDDNLEGAWDSVFQAGRQQTEDEKEEWRKKKQQKKAEKRAEKRANENANAGKWSIYVTNIPQDLSYTAVHSLFSKVGEVKRVKLYKDARGNQKGDGLVTFGSEAAVHAALERDDWALFGESLTVTSATFSEKPTLPKEEWSRHVVLCGMFDQADIGASPDPRAYILNLEEELWLEAAKFGVVERVQCFAADGACPIVVRFEEASAAQSCLTAFHGRYYDQRKIDAELYDGSRKRVIAEATDLERQARLVPPPPPPEPPAAPEPSAAAVAAKQAAKEAVEAEQAAQAAELAAMAEKAPASRWEPPPKPPPPALRLPAGGFVKLRGLRAAAERNGQVGVLKEFEPSNGRYTVQLRDGSQLALKQANLLQMLDVWLVGLSDEMAQHNGAAATIFDYDEASDMYGVELADSEAIPVSVENVVLADGAVGVVQGLKGAAQYNGSLAQVIEHDRESGRYLARLDADEKQLKLKRANLRA